MSFTPDSASPDAHDSTVARRLRDIVGDEPTREEIQEILTTAVRLYCARLDDGEEFPPFTRGAAITATDAVRTASAILDAMNLEPFELALWATWGGHPWSGDPTGGPDHG